MPKESAVFTDMDGTLCFMNTIHGITKVSTSRNGNVLVKGPSSNRIIEAVEVPGKLFTIYTDIRTRALAHELRDVADIFIATAARPSTMMARKAALNFASGYILESGAAICNADLNKDREWDDRMKSERVLIPDMIKMLEGRGLTLDIEGRTSAIRIRQQDNPHVDAETFEQFYEELMLPDGLKKTRNLGHIDVILASAGKDNAAKFLMERGGYKIQKTYGVGDDVNDIPLLNTTGHGLILGSAFPEAIAYANENGMYVSEGKHFDGINEIIGEIRKRIG